MPDDMPEMTHGEDPERSSAEPVVEELDEAECLQLVARQDVGRIAYTGRFGLTVFPVNYRLTPSTRSPSKLTRSILAPGRDGASWSTGPPTT